MRCVICGKKIEDGRGNNPYPVKKEGQCCNDCNAMYVVKARFEALLKVKGAK